MLQYTKHNRTEKAIVINYVYIYYTYTMPLKRLYLYLIMLEVEKKIMLKLTVFYVDVKICHLI